MFIIIFYKARLGLLVLSNVLLMCSNLREMGSWCITIRLVGVVAVKFGCRSSLGVKVIA